MAVNARDEEQSGNHHLGLGLSLSLGLATEAPVEVEPPPRRRAISVAPISSLPAPQRWNGPGLFFSPFFGTMDLSLERKQQRQPPATCHSHETPFTRGTDVMNRAPAGKTRRGGSCSEGEEQPGASSPNTTPISSLSGKRAAPARSGEEVGPEADHNRRGAGGGSDDEDCVASGGSRKKLRLSKGQAAVLEESFKEHSILNPKQKAALAKQLNLRTRQVEVWFQNRRARTKLKQTEADCEVLKRCCETLAEENRRLQRQVVELRALELVPLAPHHHARMPPPTALTMRPFCVRCAFPVPVFVDGPAARKL